MTAEIVPFNPLDKRNLGASVAEAMLVGTVHPLGKVDEFYGAGIYAIYYTGSFAPYKKIADLNKGNKWNAPIYVGKAVPAGARKGGGNVPGTKTKALYSRLAEHAESIKEAKSLNIADFFCRYLVVDDIWIPLGESLLIARYSPVWNSLIDGFGNHDPGKGRYNGMRPRWDVLHPGRAWAEKCRPRAETAATIIREVEEYLRNARFPTSDQLITP